MSQRVLPIFKQSNIKLPVEGLTQEQLQEQNPDYIQAAQILMSSKPQ